MSADVFKRYAETQRRRRLLDDELKAIKAELKVMEESVLEALVQIGAERITVDGFTLSPRIELWAGVDYQPGETTDAGYQRACAALQAAGLSEYPRQRFNVQSLSAFFRELASEQGYEDPEELLPQGLIGAIKITETVKVSCRAAS